jgi:hypothetical protein
MSVVDPAQGKEFRCSKCKQVLFRICGVEQNENIFIPESVKSEFGKDENGKQYCICPGCRTKNWIENPPPQPKEPQKTQ